MSQDNIPLHEAVHVGGCVPTYTLDFDLESRKFIIPKIQVTPPPIIPNPPNEVMGYGANPTQGFGRSPVHSFGLGGNSRMEKRDQAFISNIYSQLQKMDCEESTNTMDVG